MKVRVRNDNSAKENVDVVGQSDVGFSYRITIFVLFFFKDGLGIKPKMPYNFSWVIDGTLAAMGFPSKDSNIAFLIENGITRLITLMAHWKPDVGNFPGKYIQQIYLFTL